MATVAADDSYEFLGEGGSDCEDYDAEEDIGDAKLVRDIGGGLGEDVAGQADGEKAEEEVENVVSEVMLFAARKTRWFWGWTWGWT